MTVTIKSFQLSDEQYKRYINWSKTLPEEPPTAIGGGETFSFTPTGIGIVIKIKRWDGNELDLTDYENW